MRGLSLVVASGGHSSSRCAGLSLSWPLLLRSTGSRRAGSVVVAHGPSCSAACGILPDQGSNPCPLHWQADSQPLHHQGSPSHRVLIDSPAHPHFHINLRVSLWISTKNLVGFLFELLWIYRSIWSLQNTESSNPWIWHIVRNQDNGYCLFCILYKWIILYLFNIRFVMFVNFVACNCTFFLLLCIIPLREWISHNLCIHPIVDGHLCGFHTVWGQYEQCC